MGTTPRRVGVMVRALMRFGEETMPEQYRLTVPRRPDDRATDGLPFQTRVLAIERFWVDQRGHPQRQEPQRS